MQCFSDFTPLSTFTLTTLPTLCLKKAIPSSNCKHSLYSGQLNRALAYNQPCKWCLAVKTWHVCSKEGWWVTFLCHYRKLNDVVKTYFSLPTISRQRCAHTMYWAHWFYNEDLKGGYHREGKESTASSTPSCKFRFQVVSFGLCNSP